MLSISVRLSVVLSLCLFNLGSVTAIAAEPKTSKLTLNAALNIALNKDEWQNSSSLTQEAIRERAVALGQLPDTKLSATLANLATDTLRFNQERMTQIQLSASQVFPRGDTLALREKRGRLNSERQLFQRQLRLAKIGLEVTTLWLDSLKVRRSITLIKKSRPLFDQLAELTLASYAAVTSNTQQQDIVRAQLERTLLDDRLSVLKQQLAKLEQQLTGWLVSADGNWRTPTGKRIYENKLPQLALLQSTTNSQTTTRSSDTQASRFLHHPMIEMLDKTIVRDKTTIELERQGFKPQWGVKLGYGYRKRDPNGVNRSDLVSVGISMDFPLFSKQRPRSNVRAAALERDANISDRLLLLRDMNTKFNALLVQQSTLTQRAQLYRRAVLPQMKQQAQASLNAYTADNGNFSEVVRARIVQLNGRIDALNIAVEQQQLIAQMNYLLATTERPVQLTSPSSSSNTAQD
ncbi:MAG: TolC family protein [Oceanospirillaceae bacterium]